MSEEKPTIGRAIDQIVDALKTFEEQDKKTILSTVCSHLQITVGTAVTPTPGRPAPQVEIPATPSADLHRHPAAKGKHGLDIRTLKDQKQPTSARQMACLVAYYLQEHAPEEERKTTISTADLEKYFKQAGFKLPGKLEQLLGDCKRSGYFESPSRGEYKLTRVGYNLVTHSLPGKAQP